MPQTHWSNWNPLHPQADLATSRPTRDPVLATVEHSYRRNSSNSFTTKLSQLIAGAAVDINEAVHVTDTESLDVGLGIHLPLGTKASGTQVSIIFASRERVEMIFKLTWLPNDRFDSCALQLCQGGIPCQKECDPASMMRYP